MTGAADRLVSLASLGVLLYAIRRNEAERARLIAALEHDRESFRHERRELINRVQFPMAMPTASRPVGLDDRPASPVSAAPGREEWARVGRADAPMFALPRDGDEVPE